MNAPIGKTIGLKKGGEDLVSEPPVISKDLEKDLRKQGALLVSKTLVAFKAQNAPERASLEKIGFSFRSSDSSGRIWYKYEGTEPTVDKQ